MRNMGLIVVFIFLCLVIWGYKKNPDGCAKLGNDVVHDATIIFTGTNVPPDESALAGSSSAPGTVAIVPPTPPSGAVPVVAPSGVSPIAPSPAPAAMPSGMPEFATDYDSALAAARKANAPLLILFTGSDWCPYCQKLEQEVLSTPDFKNYRSAHYVFLKVDDLRNTPVADADKQKIKQLEQKFSVQGFPTLVMVDDSETEKGRLEGYNPGSGVAAVTGQLDKFAAK